MVIIYIMTILSIINYVWICMVIYPCYITYYFIYIYCWSDPHYEKKHKTCFSMVKAMVSRKRCRQIPELVAKKEQAIIVLRQVQQAASCWRYN